MNNDTTTTTTTAASSAWVRHSETTDTIIDRKEFDGATIYRLRDRRSVLNDSFLVARDGKTLGSRASIKSAQILAAR